MIVNRPRRSAGRSAWAAAVISALAMTLIACGGSGSQVRSSKTVKPKLPPVNKQALRAFDSALRALRLGGPEATEKATGRFERALEHDAKLWEAWYNLGVLRLRDGNFGDAVSGFSKALAINPAHTESLLGRAEARRALRHVSRASNDYEKAMTLLADDHEPYRQVGARLVSLLREAKRFERALDVLREVLRVAGADAAIHVELSLVYLAQGRKQLASLVLTKAAAINAKEPTIYNASALLAMERGEPQKAFELFDYATSLDPNYTDARLNKAGLLMSAGDYKAAQAELSVVLEKRPDDLSAQVALGIVERASGNFDQARTTWSKVVKRAVKADPNRGDALFNLAVLEMDFVENMKNAKDALERYLQETTADHPKRKQAKTRMKELGL